MIERLLRLGRVCCVAVIGIAATLVGSPAAAQAEGPVLLDQRLAVRTVVTGLVAPTTMAFIGHRDLLVLEKTTGKVQRVRDGAIHSTVLDLAVNSGSEAS